MSSEYDITNYIVDLNQFKIIKKNKWKGACGYISIVKEKTTNTQYVAKVLKNSLKNDANAQRDFFNHIKIEHILRGYPNIVNFVGFNLSSFQECDNSINPTIFLEFVNNGTLDEYLESNNLSKKKTKFLSNTKKQICMLGIAIGAHIIHQNDIVHLDLKPDNILLDENLYPKINDFGSAKFINHQFQKNDDDDEKNSFPSSVVSAPLFTSPEILKLSSFNEKADVYSYAYILYKIISGIDPKIESESILEMFNNILKGKRPDLSIIQKEQKKFKGVSLHIDNLESLLLSDSLDDLEIEYYGFAKLISECWDQDPKNRPSFFDIINRFLSDKSLLLPDVDIEEVDNYLKKFDNIEILSRIKPNSNDKSGHLHFRTNYNGEIIISQKKSKNCKNLNKFDISDYNNLDELCKRQIDYAVDTRDIESCSTVGYNLANGFNGFPRCINEAVKYLRIAIEGGNPSAMNTYANLLMQKSSVASSENLKEKRNNTAKQLYKIAADLGNTFAMIEYSKILYKEIQSNEQKQKGNKKIFSTKKIGHRQNKDDLKQISSSLAIPLSNTFASAIYSRSNSAPIKLTNNNNNDSNENNNNNNDNENDDICEISTSNETINNNDDKFNNFKDHDVDSNFENQFCDSNADQEFEEEEEEEEYNDYEIDTDTNNSNKIPDIINDNNYSDIGESDSNEAKWSESMRYMKLAADSENLIAINMYSEMFVNEDEQQNMVKTISKSMYRFSSKELDQE